MSKSAIHLAVFVIVLAVLGVAGIVGVRSITAEPDKLDAASPEEVANFEDLIRRDQRIQFDAKVSGDISLFPTIYYNDPTVKLHSDYRKVLDQYGDEARAAVADLIGAPVEAGEDGYLTARIASVIWGQRNVAAWEDARATASATGREPSITDLPAGFVPLERMTADQWIEQKYYVFDAKVGDNHATAKLAFGPPEAGGQILSYVFTRVDGTWYISSMESTWSQGDPDYQQDGTPPSTPVADLPQR